MKKHDNSIHINPKIKPFNITFQVCSIDEAKMLLLMFENSPTLFGNVIDHIREKLSKQGHIV